MLSPVVRAVATIFTVSTHARAFAPTGYTGDTMRLFVESLYAKKLGCGTEDFIRDRKVAYRK